jgi:NAD+ kinase
LATGLDRAFNGDFDVLPLPGIEVCSGQQTWLAMNDVSFHRKQGLRVADLAFDVAEDEVGRVRCDGLVVATPAGSTGYNLANGGPVMAWGVEGLAVSFIAPHSLTARALVVAPQDAIRVRNRSREEPVDVSVDGRPVCELPPDGVVSARFVDNVGTLAQTQDASFYHRLREKFGRLATGG